MRKWILAALALVVTAVGVWAVLRPEGSVEIPRASPPEQKSYIDEALDRMTLRQKIASLFIFHSPGTDAKKLGAFADKYQPGGFILMADNIPASSAALQKETAALRGKDEKLPRLVAIDQEGGTVRRLAGDDFPAGEQLRNLPPQQAEAAFRQRSDMLRSTGVTLNFGIVADVTNDKSSFIYPRVLGTSPGVAADHVAAAIRGTKGRTLSTLKHFPGHGETVDDSHHSIPTTNTSYAAWKNRDALPFSAGIVSGADVVMMGHLRYSAVDSAPASLSAKWHEILRNELNFSGAIITDDMCMLQNSGERAYRDPVKNAVAALSAGTTLLLYVLNNQNAANTKIDPNRLIDGIVAAAKDGTLAPEKIDTAARLALELRTRAVGFAKP